MSDSEVTKHIFDKEVICPVCLNKFKTKAVKAKSPRIVSKDSDFLIRYSGVNPYFYDVWVCNSCGYSAVKGDFNKFKSYKKDIVMSKITSKWRPREYPDVIDAKLAIERYKLALLTCIVTESLDSAKAMIFLKIGWMYRLLEDKANENEFLEKSINEFLVAYKNEDFPMYGLDKGSLSYLIGELYRRIGNNKDALFWFSKTLTGGDASYKIKELAHTQKDLINNK